MATKKKTSRTSAAKGVGGAATKRGAKKAPAQKSSGSAKRPAAKAAKKPAATKKTAAKKGAAKKAVAKKAVAKPAAKKAVAKKAVAKPAAKKAVAKKAAAKKAVAKKPAAKSAAKKAVAKKAVAKSAAKKPVAKSAAKKPVTKSTPKKPVAKRALEAPAIAAREARVMERHRVTEPAPPPEEHVLRSAPVAVRAAPRDDSALVGDVVSVSGPTDDDELMDAEDAEDALDELDDDIDGMPTSQRATLPPREHVRLSVEIAAAPERVFAAWIDGELHGAMTGAGASSDPRVGGMFTAWDGYITGEHLELDAPTEDEPRGRIVQTWRTTQFEAADPHSVLALALEPIDGGTLLLLEHSEIPAGQGAAYATGWREHYFEPMRRFFSGE